MRMALVWDRWHFTGAYHSSPEAAILSVSTENNDLWQPLAGSEIRAFSVGVYFDNR